MVTVGSNNNSSANTTSTGPFMRSKTKLATSRPGQATPVKSTHMKAHIVNTTTLIGVIVYDKLKSIMLLSIIDDDADPLVQLSRSISYTNSSSDSSSGPSPGNTSKAISSKQSNSNTSSYTMEMSVMMTDRKSVV